MAAPILFSNGHFRMASCYGISIYNLVELKSFVRKLLMQFARNRRETRNYYRAPHGDGYKGVSARFPSFTENDAMFFVRLGLCIRDSGYLTFSNAAPWQGSALALCHTTALQLTLSMAPY